MYLQLAENNMDSNYVPVETNQGTIYVRRDLAEDVTLSAGGKGLQIAGKIVSTASKFVPLPGAQVIGNIAGGVLTKAGQAKAGGGSAVQAGIQAGQQAGIGSKLKGALAKLKAKGTAPEATALPEAIVAKTTAPAEAEEKPSFFKKYKTPILIGGGVLLAGTAVYLLTRKKKR